MRRRFLKDGFSTERRLAVYASGVALGYAITLIWQLMYNNFRIGLPAKDCLDFTWIWLSSKLALSSTIAQVYDYSSFSAARVALVGPPNCVLEHFDYPPTLLLFTFPLGFLPYAVAFVAWMGLTLLVYLAAVYAIIPRAAAIIAALTPYPVFINFLLGHNGFLTAGLLGLALAFMEGRPWVSGIFLGLLTYKPQFGILVPLALVASRNWRVLLSTTIATVIFGLAATLVFGFQAWPSFIEALVDRGSALNDDPRLSLYLLSVSGFLRAFSISPQIAWSAQLAITGVLAATVYAVWALPISHSLKAAALAIASLLAAPHAFSYDFCILTVAVAFLVKEGLSRGFRPRERGVMFGCWAGLNLLFGPFPAAICVVLLVLVVRRILGWRERAPDTPRPAFGTP